MRWLILTQGLIEDRQVSRVKVCSRVYSTQKYQQNWSEYGCSGLWISMKEGRVQGLCNCCMLTWWWGNKNKENNLIFHYLDKKILDYLRHCATFGPSYNTCVITTEPPWIITDLYKVSHKPLSPIPRGHSFATPTPVLHSKMCPWAS